MIINIHGKKKKWEGSSLEDLGGGSNFNLIFSYERSCTSELRLLLPLKNSNQRYFLHPKTKTAASS